MDVPFGGVGYKLAPLRILISAFPNWDWVSAQARTNVFASSQPESQVSVVFWQLEADSPKIPEDCVFAPS
jgi:hypothetical protein